MRSLEISGNQPSEELKSEVQKRLKIIRSTHADSGLYYDSTNLYEDEMNYVLLVNKVPTGEAPEEIRQAWLEVMFPHARRMRSHVNRVGFLTRNRYQAAEGANYFGVKTADALQALIEGGTIKEYEAALWFLKQPYLGNMLLFCEDEFIIVEQKPLPVNRSYENPRSN